MLLLKLYWPHEIYSEFKILLHIIYTCTCRGCNM